MVGRKLFSAHLHLGLLCNADVMILILSEASDQSTNDVIDWLNHFQLNYFRINETDKIRIRKITIKEEAGFNANLEVEKAEGKCLELELSDVKAYWYRRGNFNIEFNPIKDRKYANVSWYVNKYLFQEREKLATMLHHHLQTVPHINSYFDNHINKLHVLSVASRVGLKIPETSVISSKKALHELLQQKRLVTKALSEGGFQVGKKIGAGAYTSLVSESEAQKLDDNFFPSLMQAYIKKKWDIRVFYLDRRLYASVILSQQKEESVDFRDKGPDHFAHRVVPYNLSPEVERKLRGLMDDLGLNCGSVDLVEDQDGEVIFLEINPIGQFGFISKACNYGLEYRIAKTLCKYEKTL